MSNNVQSATITPILVAGSTESPYLYLVNITQKLCVKACVDNPPVFTPQFFVKSVSSLGNNLYAATVQVQGTISYVPCCQSSCCARMQTLYQAFTIPFVSETAPTNVTIASGDTVNTIAATACQNCSRTFVSETPLTLTVTTA